MDDFSDQSRSDKTFPAPSLPVWRLAPARAEDPFYFSYEEFCDKVDAYFGGCAEQETSPKLTELALALGFDSLTQMMNDARRRPELQRPISRALSVIGVTYEEMLQNGNHQAASFILPKIPSFDSREAPTAPPTFFLRDRTELAVHIAGLDLSENRGKELSPREAYLALVKNRIIEEETVPQKQIIEGDYVEIPLGETE